MSFFDQPAPPPPRRRQQSPPWAGPATGVLPAISDERVLLIASDEIVLAVDQFLVYPNGIEFTLRLTTKDQSVGPQGPPWEARHHIGSDDLPDDLLRFGIQFPDGTKWSNLNWEYPSHDSDPTGPLVLSRGGGGGDHTYRMRFWMWPLPRPGTLSFVASWPAKGVDETQVELDTSKLHELANSAQTYWGPDG